MATPGWMDNRVGCPYYHEDSHRQATKRACRLIARNPSSEPWQPSLCGTCPVPGLLRANPCRHLALEARVVRKWGVLRRVEPYTVCAAKFIELGAPAACWQGCEQFSPPPGAASGLISVDALLATVDEPGEPRG